MLRYGLEFAAMVQWIFTYFDAISIQKHGLGPPQLPPEVSCRTTAARMPRKSGSFLPTVHVTMALKTKRPASIDSAIDNFLFKV